MGSGMAGIPLNFDKSETAVGIGQLLQLSQLCAVDFHGDGSDLLVLQRTVHAVGLHLRNGIHNFQAGSNLTKCSILAIQMLCILVHDEELRACGVGVTVDK